MKKIEKAIAKTINTVINLETFGWPPVCAGIMYQPERPKADPRKQSEDIQKNRLAKK